MSEVIKAGGKDRVRERYPFLISFFVVFFLLLVGGSFQHVYEQMGMIP